VEDPKVRALLRFIQTDEPGEDDFSKRLSEFVAKVKENEKFRKEFANMNLHDFDIMTEAKEEGIQEKAIENALTLIRDYNALPEVAAEKMGAPLDKVLEALNHPSPAN
jgi:hypothetical protein